MKPRVTGDFAVPTNVNKYIHIHMFKGPKRTDPFRNTSATRGNNNDRITNGQTDKRTDGRLVENECWQGRRFGQDTLKVRRGEEHMVQTGSGQSTTWLRTGHDGKDWTADTAWDGEDMMAGPWYEQDMAPGGVFGMAR